MKKALKVLRIVCIVLAVLVAAYFAMSFIPRGQNYTEDNPVRKDDTTILIAHGGGNKEFPDNTLEAFYNAYSVDENVMMETDVSITKDGVLILSHDLTLDRKTNATGYISDWNYSDLIAQKVDFGYTNDTDGVEDTPSRVGDLVHFTTDDGEERYPTDVDYPDGVEARDDTVFLATTLEELLVAFPENRINVEIKQSGELGMTALKEALRLIEKYDAYDRVVLASFHEEIYEEYQRLQAENEVPVTFLCSPATKSFAKFYFTQLFNVDFAYNDQIAVLQIPVSQYGLNFATKHLVNAAHRHNIAVHYWTIDDPDEMRKLIAIGADGIETNYPHRLKEVLDEG
jgi:glycerophosphoryl diester phosphodiesterase